MYNLLVTRFAARSIAGDFRWKNLEFEAWNFEFAAGSGKLQHESKIQNIGPLLKIHFVMYLIDSFRNVFD